MLPKNRVKNDVFEFSGSDSIDTKIKKIEKTALEAWISKDREFISLAHPNMNVQLAKNRKKHICSLSFWLFSGVHGVSKEILNFSSLNARQLENFTKIWPWLNDEK